MLSFSQCSPCRPTASSHAGCAPFAATDARPDTALAARERPAAMRRISVESVLTINPNPPFETGQNQILNVQGIFIRCTTHGGFCTLRAISCALRRRERRCHALRSPRRVQGITAIAPDSDARCARRGSRWDRGLGKPALRKSEEWTGGGGWWPCGAHVLDWNALERDPPAELLCHGSGELPPPSASCVPPSPLALAPPEKCSALVPTLHMYSESR